MPDKMPENIPEDMSGRMPENRPDFHNQCSHEVASACLYDVHDVLPHARGRAASSSRRLSRHGADMANGKYG